MQRKLPNIFIPRWLTDSGSLTTRTSKSCKSHYPGMANEEFSDEIYEVKLSGEKRMWAAALRNALLCYRSPRQDVRDETIKWLNEKSMRTGSLMWICQALNLDPDFVRNKIITHQGKLPRMRGYGIDSRIEI